MELGLSNSESLHQPYFQDYSIWYSKPVNHLGNDLAGRWLNSVIIRKRLFQRAMAQSMGKLISRQLHNRTNRLRKKFVDKKIIFWSISRYDYSFSTQSIQVVTL